MLSILFKKQKNLFFNCFFVYNKYIILKQQYKLYTNTNFLVIILIYSKFLNIIKKIF